MKFTTVFMALMFVFGIHKADAESGHAYEFLASDGIKIDVGGNIVAYEKLEKLYEGAQQISLEEMAQINDLWEGRCYIKDKKRGEVFREFISLTAEEKEFTRNHGPLLGNIRVKTPLVLMMQPALAYFGFSGGVVLKLLQSEDSSYILIRKENSMRKMMCNLWEK